MCCIEKGVEQAATALLKIFQDPLILRSEDNNSPRDKTAMIAMFIYMVFDINIIIH